MSEQTRAIAVTVQHADVLAQSNSVANIPDREVLEAYLGKGYHLFMMSRANEQAHTERVAGMIPNGLLLPAIAQAIHAVMHFEHRDHSNIANDMPIIVVRTLKSGQRQWSLNISTALGWDPRVVDMEKNRKLPLYEWHPRRAAQSQPTTAQEVIDLARSQKASHIHEISVSGFRAPDDVDKYTGQVALSYLCGGSRINDKGHLESPYSWSEVIKHSFETGRYDIFPDRVGQTQIRPFTMVYEEDTIGAAAAGTPMLPSSQPRMLPEGHGKNNQFEFSVESLAGLMAVMYTIPLEGAPVEAERERIVVGC